MTANKPKEAPITELLVIESRWGQHVSVDDETIVTTPFLLDALLM